MTSRRQLYALGEPFGDSCTRIESGRRIYGGGGGGGDSTEQSTTTQNTDKRQVVDGSSVGVSSDMSTVNVSMLDAGAIQKAFNLVDAAGAETIAASMRAVDANAYTVDQAFSLVKDVGRASLEAYDHLLNTTAMLATQAQATMTTNSDLAGQLASSATSTAADENSSSILNLDDKTKQYLMLAAAGVGIFMITKKG